LRYKKGKGFYGEATKEKRKEFVEEFEKKSFPAP
jgi:hypothetical protein